MAEAVGLVLSIAPLIISATEHYSEAANCIKRYRKHAKIVRGLVQELNVQQTIFRHANIRLLAHSVDPEYAFQMLDNRHHPGWRDGDIARLYLARLGDSRQAILDSVSLIDDLLTSLRKIIGEFSDPCIDFLNHNSAETKDSVKKRIKLAFKSADIRSLMDELMQKTQAFVTLVEMTEPPQERRYSDKPSFSTQKSVAQIAKIKDAADNLYQALGYACTKHTEHQAHLSLESTCSNSYQVQFTLAFRHRSLQRTADSSSDRPHLTWLTVESSVSGTIQSTDDTEVLNQLRNSMKRLRDSSPPKLPPSKPAKLKKSVKFSDESQTPACPVMRQQALSWPISNLCQNSNFCNQLQKIAAQVKPGTNYCIGYLEHTRSSKHLIYVDNKIQSVTSGPSANPLTSLDGLLKSTVKARLTSGPLSQHERVHLARQLALAVLQFHATPWLQNSWTSKDVLLTPKNCNNDDSHVDSYGPYLDVCISGAHGPLQKSTTFPSRTLIRNNLLFNLGVMLLELAFQKPLRQMQEACDVDRHEDHNTDYYTANRVRMFASDLGPKYAEIVRKCIQCDFGFGDDMSKRSLQEGFYQGVIAELERLEAILSCN